MFFLPKIKTMNKNTINIIYHSPTYFLKVQNVSLKFFLATKIYSTYFAIMWSWWNSKVDRKAFKERTGKDWSSSEEPKCSGCDTFFTVLRRRHHCRECGGEFCYICSGMTIKNSRACVFCFVEERKKKSNSFVGEKVSSPHSERTISIGSDIEILSDRETFQSFRYHNSVISTSDQGIIYDLPSTAQKVDPKQIEEWMASSLVSE